MSTEYGYYRHPTINGDSIVFVTEDDLWSVPAEGGVARRLTANPGISSFPVLSPNGESVAYTSRDEGHTEVNVMDADGGPPRRLTWLGTVTQTAGWSKDGSEVIFASQWRQPFRGFMQLFAVPADGGPVRPLDVGPARAFSLQPDGPGMVIGRNSGDPARWKRYRGGTAGTLWIDRAGDGSFRPLIRLEGNLASPMWIGSRVYFLSDHEGTGNLYSVTPTGRSLKRHSHHEDFYVRFPNSDGRRIAYHAGADLYVFDPEDGAPDKLDVQIRSAQPQRSRKFVDTARYWRGLDLHPQGHSLALVARGGLYSFGLWEGAVSRHGSVSDTRYRLGRWLPDGKRIVAVTDEEGEEALVVLPAEGGEAGHIMADIGRATDLAVAPAGDDRVALTNQRQEVILIDLETGATRTIERSPYGRILGMAWSPDGRWLAYGYENSNTTSRIHLYDTQTRRVTPVTAGDFQDAFPAFDPDGHYLYFVSRRVFNPVPDQIYFDHGFPQASLPMLVTLQADLHSPFSDAHREPRAPGAPADGPPKNDNAKESEKKKDNGDEEEKPPAPVEIDLEGIADRVEAFPVKEAIYRKVAGIKGKALLLSFPAEGTLGEHWSDTEIGPKGRLEAFDFDKQKAEPVHEAVSWFTTSADAKVVAIRSGKKLRVVPAGFKPDEKPGNDKPGRESGWVDLGRVRVEVVPGAEWRQMFREAWRLQRDQFWTPDMSGVDWTAVHDRYLPLVDRVASRSEFSDLMWEMQGELGTSHSYELGGDYRPEPKWFQGFLGADIEFDGRAWIVARIPEGDSWDAATRSPLADPGIDVREGDRIVAVGGVEVDRRTSPDALLVHRAGESVVLTLRRGRRRAHSVTVRTLKNEQPLRYRDWVEANRRRVHEETDGQVGYIHVPDMGAWGFSEFHRYYLSEFDRDGLIVDVRYNGGGSVSSLLLNKLTRRRVGYDVTRWGQPSPYPDFAPQGPMVALTNEYAGSDGDIFSHSFKLYELGPLIGKRTWGGVIGIWPRHALVDGSITTQPEFSFWFEDVGWGVENYGTDPDIEVEIKPQDYAEGRDPQLERGIREVLKILRRHKPKLPDLDSRPSRTPPKLPDLPE